MTDLPSALAAGLLLAAIPVLRAHDLPAPTGTAALEATGASRTTAYKVKGAIEAVLPDLLQPSGRPPKPPPEPPADLQALLARVRDFVFDHPGCVTGEAKHRCYSDMFRLFVLDLAEKRKDLDLDQVAQVTGVPLGTLKDWLRGERPQVEPPDNLAAVPGPSQARIETVLAAWEAWANKASGFRAFCHHVQFHLRIPFSRQQIKDILHAHEVRIPRKRRRPPDASALRAGFETFFPGAQWVGDGKQVTIDLLGQRFTFNLELMVDPDSGAFTGASVRPTEDAQAVTEAFDDGVTTTTAPPLALLLDNKPSNHSAEVADALGDDTLLLRSRPFVPTDKPHVEGAFGLFAQEAPPLVLTGTTPEQLAQEIVVLVVTAWARAVNHRPRADRNGKTRTQLYQGADPTPEELEQARKALRERQRKQRRAQQTRTRRQDPVVRAALDEAFARLGLDDPDGHLRAAIASWPLDAVLAGIAVFEGKKNAGTLPKDADARYLRGTVNNIAQEAEGMAIAEALLRERLAARDKMLDHLGRQRDDLEDDAPEPEDLVKAFVERALDASRQIDRIFWLLATTDVITDQDSAHHPHLLRLAARRIHATFAVPHRERLAATRFLFRKVTPVA